MVSCIVSSIEDETRVSYRVSNGRLAVHRTDRIEPVGTLDPEPYELPVF